MVQQCRHIKASGQRCGSPVIDHKPYCYFHMKFDRMHKRDTPEIPPVEDSTSILLGMGQLVRALNFETMDLKRGRLMLSVLRSAGEVARHVEKLPPVQTVHSVHNLEGDTLDFTQAAIFGADMLAPEADFCETPQDRPTCERNATDTPAEPDRKAPKSLVLARTKPEHHAPQPVSRENTEHDSEIIDYELHPEALKGTMDDPDMSDEEARKLVWEYVRQLDEEEAERKKAGCPRSVRSDLGI